jgi:large subunit ribosomal protein L9
MRQVTLILREPVASLGEAGDVVKVKPGFARNFLIPQGKAMVATAAHVRELEHQKRVVAERVAKELKSFVAMRDRIQSLSLELKARVGEEGKLFGSVTVLQIAEQLAAKGVEVDRRKIDLPEPIREVGEYTVPVKLHRDVIASLRVKVSPEE